MVQLLTSYLLVHPFEKKSVWSLYLCVILLHLPHHLDLSSGAPGRRARQIESTKMETSTHSRCFGL